MPVSKEVQMAVDEIHRERDALKAAYDANSLQGSQIADLKSQVESLKAGAQLSEDDKQALLDAINEAQQTNSALASAVPANVPDAPPVAPDYVPPAPLPDDPLAPRPDPIAGTGQSGTVPPMPNLAFDPSGSNAGADSPAIATAGGFVVSGGGAVQRAPEADVHPMSEAGVAAQEGEAAAGGDVDTNAPEPPPPNPAPPAAPAS